MVVAGRRALPCPGGERREAEGEDHPQRPRHPEHRGEELREPRLRLRLRVRRGQHLHDRRLLRHDERPALALLRPRRQKPRGRPEPQRRPLLPAGHRPRHRRGPGRPGAAARPAKRGAKGGRRLRQGLQQVPREDRGREHPRPALRRRRVGAPDHRDRRLPALLRARALREQRGGDQRHHQRPAARGRGRRGGVRARSRGGRRDHPGRARRDRGARRGARLRRRRSAPTPGRSAARRRSPAAGWCSATRTSRGRARGASTSRT